MREWGCQFQGRKLPPRLIRERLPGAKIIIVLRDPGKRAYPYYLADIRGPVHQGSDRGQRKIAQ